MDGPHLLKGAVRTSYTSSRRGPAPHSPTWRASTSTHTAGNTSANIELPAFASRRIFQNNSLAMSVTGPGVDSRENIVTGTNP